MDATWVEWEELGARWEAQLGRLASSVGLGNSLAVDYCLAMLIGALFPLGRWVMDRALYDVRGVGWCVCVWWWWWGGIALA